MIAWRPRVWPGGHGQRFFGTINRVSSWVFDLEGPRLDCQANLAPPAPLRRGFTFEGNRYRCARKRQFGKPWCEMDIAT